MEWIIVMLGKLCKHAMLLPVAVTGKNFMTIIALWEQMRREV
jgi:hypothetical protein